MRKRDKRALAQEKQKQRNRTPEDQSHIDRLLDAIKKKGCRPPTRSRSRTRKDRSVTLTPAVTQYPLTNYDLDGQKENYQWKRFMN